MPDSSEERAVTFLPEDIEGAVGQGCAGLFEVVEAGVEVDEGEGEVEAGGQGFEDAAAGGDDFAADAVARDEACSGC